MLKAIEACSLYASLNPFNSGSETEAKILCKSLSIVQILIRTFCATCFNSIQEHTILFYFFTEVNLFKLLTDVGAGCIQHVLKPGKKYL